MWNNKKSCFPICQTCKPTLFWTRFPKSGPTYRWYGQCTGVHSRHYGYNWNKCVHMPLVLCNSQMWHKYVCIIELDHYLGQVMACHLFSTTSFATWKQDAKLSLGPIFISYLEAQVSWNFASVSLDHFLSTLKLTWKLSHWAKYQVTLAADLKYLGSL